jgi:diadenosine tetraphosphate (Ap4A) HIT family hydrolase
VLLAGFLILQPKRHVEHVGDLSADEATRLGHILSRACRALQEELKPEKVYVCSFGSLVKHVHFYLIPRMPEMPGDLSGDELLRAIFDGRWACSDETAAELARGVREEIGIAARQN